MGVPYHYFETTALLFFSNLEYFAPALFARFHRITDEVLIAETVVWSIFFLSLFSLLLKDLNFFILIYQHTHQVYEKVITVSVMLSIINYNC